jgi:hypothetical protein
MKTDYSKTLPLVRDSFKLLWTCISAPDKAFEKIAKDENALLDKMLVLYVFYLACSLIFFMAKPADFAAPMLGAAMPAVQPTLSTWLLLELLTAAGFVVSVFLLSLVVPFSLRFGESLLVPLCLLFAGAPALLMFFFSDAHNSAAYFVLCMLFLYAGLWLIAHSPDFQYRKLISMSVLLNTLDTIGKIFQTPAIALHSGDLYRSIDFIVALWVFVLTVRGVAYFCKLSIAKSVTAVLAAAMAYFIIILAAAHIGLIQPSTLSLFLLA